MKNKINKLIFIYSVTALCFALVLEHIFGLLPCRLCTYQRIPYLLIIIIFIIQLIFRPSDKIIITLISLCLLGELYYALNHSLLSLGIINSSGCESAVKLPSDLNDLRNALQNNTLIVDCENANKKFFGLHLSTYNAFASLIFLILILKNVFNKK